MSRRRVVAAVATVVAVVAVGAGVAVAQRDDGPTPSREATDRPCGRPYVEVLAAPPPLKNDARLRRVTQVEEPAAAIFRPDGSGDGLLASRLGVVWRIDGGRVTRDEVLDLSDDTVQSGDGGLLGLAYDPDGRWLYVYRTLPTQDDRITAYPLDAEGRPDADGERVVLAIEHGPSEQHHGGGFAFGPDGFLYIGLGDGGGLGDPRENAQDPSTILGKVLRIRPTPEADQPYAVPPDNPFVDRSGWRPEIFALGLRNPFRLGFDPATGDLWIGDVGQTCWEELDRLPAGTSGQNLGWDVREGTHRFEGGALTGGTSTEPEQSYAHRRGWCAIVLGPVGPDGVLHTDYCRGRIMRFVPGSPATAPQLFDTGLRVRNPVALVAGPDGPDGNPWVLSLEGDVFEVELE
jgi:glucose/arabinose dehydrogenase